MSSTTSICAEGGLALHIFLDPQFIFDWSCAVPVIQFMRYSVITHLG